MPLDGPPAIYSSRGTRPTPPEDFRFDYKRSRGRCIDERGETAEMIETQQRADRGAVLMDRSAMLLRSGTVPGRRGPTDNGSAFTARAFRLVVSGWRHASPRRLPRPRKPSVHRVLVRKAQAALRLAARVQNPRRATGGNRNSHRRLPPPPAQRARLQNPSRGRPDLGRYPRRPTTPAA